MSDFPPNNPYSTPSYQQQYGQPSGGGGSNAKIMAPAIVMIVLGALGIVLSILGVFMAMGPPEPVDPELPEFLRNLQEGQRGPVAIAIQAIFIFVNAAIVLGGVCMLRLKAWVFCLIASILLILNFGNCICFAGIPVGIWSIVILSLEDVRRKFASNS